MNEAQKEKTRTARARPRQARGNELAGLRSWVSAAIGASVLILGGFLLGVTLGVVSEEPEIVARHLIGQSEEVAWHAGAPGEVPAPLDPTSAEEAPLTPPVPAVSAAPEAVLAASGGSGVSSELAVSGESAVSDESTRSAGWVVQVGAFSRSSSADALAESLKGKGFQAYLKPTSGPSDGRWRVRVGPLATQSEARRLAQRLEREESLATWVLAEGGG